MIKQMMSVPRARKPEHIMYDSCCLARQQAEKIPWFKGIGMCIDPWHFETSTRIHTSTAESIAMLEIIPNS